jgi:hypothetical protein
LQNLPSCLLTYPFDDNVDTPWTRPSDA